VAGGSQQPAGAAGRFDLALTELLRPTRYLAVAGSVAGRRLLSELPQRPAPEAEVRAARAAVTSAGGRMGRRLPALDLRDLLAAAVDSPVWDEVAARCLACGNCTMACPTCFCVTTVETPDVTGLAAGRSLCWDSCFDREFSRLHGAGPVRDSVRARYRQWLSHKFGTWHDQFGESGCVGCGRCVAWCPAGIDVTEELWALAAAEGTTP
jgi:ferredoxin